MKIIHNKLNEYFKKYLYTGGMPEVVQKYIETNDMAQVRNIQKDILKSYERDFSKYAGNKESVKISEIWKSIPNQIAKENKKFKFSDKLFSEYNGAFIENYVAQELMTIGFDEFYYWKSRGQAEVDFIINFDDSIIPIKVKSGTNLKMKSLKSYADKYNPELLIRLSPRNYIKSDKFINIPLYSLFIIKEILKRELK